MTMTQRRLTTFFASALYAVGQVTLGLLLHPYQTMQSLMEQRVLLPLVLLPSGVLAVVTLVWKVVTVPLVRLVFSCQSAPNACVGLSFLSDWITFFCVYWQIMLLYLVLRFSLARKQFSN
jgi:hypothetical protein